MSDPIERLSQFRTDVEGGPMLPATEVRRRGDQLRRRKHALVAAASVAVVAAIAAPVIALTGTGVGGGRDIEPARPAPSTGTALSEADLMTDAETTYHAEADGSDWFTTHTAEGDGQAPPNPCFREMLADLGAGSVFQRDYELRGPSGEPTDPGNRMNEIIAEYDDATAAQDAYATIAGWVEDCAAQAPAAPYRVSDPIPVDPGVDGEARLYTSSYGAILGQDPESGNFMDTGLIVSGRRIAVITTVILGQDYNWETTELPVHRMIPRAAELLQPGGATPTTPSASNATTPSDPAAGAGTADPAAPTVLSADNLVTVDRLPQLPDDRAWQQVGPQDAPTLACQGEWLSALGAQETLTRDFRVRAQSAGADLAMVNVAVLQFTDRAAADTAYSTVLDWLSSCPAAHTPHGKPIAAGQPAAVRVRTSPDVADVDRAHRALVTYAPVPCDESCEAAWYDHQTVAQIGSRLVLVTEAELAGSCPPSTSGELDCPNEEAERPWRDRVTTTVERAVGAAIWDLH